MHHILLNGDFLLYYIILKRREKKEDYYTCIYRAAFRLDCNRKYIHTHHTVLCAECSTADFSLYTRRINTCRTCADLFTSIKKLFDIHASSKEFFVYFSYCQRDSLCILDTHDQHRVVNNCVRYIHAIDTNEINHISYLEAIAV